MDSPTVIEKFIPLLQESSLYLAEVYNIHYKRIYFIIRKAIPHPRTRFLEYQVPSLWYCFNSKTWLNTNWEFKISVNVSQISSNQFRITDKLNDITITKVAKAPKEELYSSRYLTHENKSLREWVKQQQKDNLFVKP